MGLDEIILRSVISNRLDTISKEMGHTLERSSRSPIFAEACDFACGITDYKGDLVSQLNGIPILAAAGTFSVKAILEKYGDNINDGDVFIINDPYWGGNHLPDIGVITPVFYENELVFFCVSRAHHGDIGGAAAGSYNARATEIFQEGIRIPPLKLFEKGKETEILEFLAYNTRNSEMLRSDLYAQMGTNKIGAKRLLEMLNQYGLKEVKTTIKNLLDQAEDLAKSYISNFPKGTFTGEEYLDDDGFGDGPLKIKATVTVNDFDIVVDFTGSDKQATGFVNSSIVTTTNAAYIAALWALSPEIPRNSGAFRTIKVIAPKGTIVNPEEPAPMTLSTLHCACEIISAILKAFSKVVPEKVPAGFGRYCGPSFFGTDPRNLKFYVGFGFCCLGSGGGMHEKDGLPYMAPISNYGGVRAPNNETNEVQYPLLTLEHQMQIDTVGAGKYQGAPGIKYSVLFYGKDTLMTMFGDGMKIPPYGLQDGKPGSLNEAYLEGKNGSKEKLPSKLPPFEVEEGEILTIITSGGGGWGPPHEREPEKVLKDIKNEILSVEKAKKEYLVEISNGEIDWEKTNKLRA